MKKILILTASFGDGHNAAARNLREALELVSDDAKVEVLDLFESTYGTLNLLMKQAYNGLVRYAPTVWSGVFSVFDNAALFRRQMDTMGKLKDSLRALLHDTEPEVVVSTYPVYGHLIEDIYRDHAERPFRFITVVTDSISVCSAWYRAASDLFVVANEPTAEVLVQNGVPRDRVRALGFPVSPLFAGERREEAAPPEDGNRRKVLYVINTGKAKAGKSLDRLLKIPEVDLTITVGRDASLKAKLSERLRGHGDRVRIYGWTNQMPQLLMSHHLVIAKAGGAMVQEAIAARCPMVINQVIPGQEEGNAKLIETLGVGAVALKGKHVRDVVQAAFEDGGGLWKLWREKLARVSRPDASVRIAELILEQANDARGGEPIRLFADPLKPRERAPSVLRSAATSQLCDFHVHTNYSDGRLTLPEVIDFYGRRGFDCICVTDHIADPKRLIGKFSELLNLTLPREQVDEYFDMLERERRRAWRKYEMIVMTGLEFNKEGLTRKTSGHLLGIDLKAPVDPGLGFVEIIAQIHSQGGLAVAAHPHVMKSEWGKNTLFLWENQEVFAPIIDAWEIANRNNIFTPIGLKRFAFLANSDFHKPKHIYSWKTLLHCEKDSEAIKECVRRNEHVSLTLYRDGMTGASLRAQAGPPREVPLPVFARAAAISNLGDGAWPEGRGLQLNSTVG
jgi:UDP-N-acetylglucosamine:LPS N-acetylglucosamine transferase/histidinol phosphatase-like PHP family hydrolase